MAEASRSHPSQYVRLKKDQDASASGPSVEDIRPGELNLPVAVPQLEQRKCFKCGRCCLRATGRPATPWTTGIFGCAEDPESLSDLLTVLCRIGLFCPCVLFGRNVQALREDIPWTTPCTCHAVCVEGGIALAILTAIFHGVDPNTSVLIGEGLVFGWWLCSIYTGNFRLQLQRRYHLENSPCPPGIVHCCFPWCANCQEHRERKGRLAESSDVPMTIVNPPPLQEMSMVENNAPTSENEASKAEHDDVEVIPL
ncbi:cell number regulator 6-like [Triticum urartu]|uniref:cell number regulator 6-like n=1 Tax=Triticum urartu TaxID=4572 RepID=UPI002044C11B|nr:cell number regulator 6-like [Triticum urartu]